MISDFYNKVWLLVSCINYGNSVPIDYCLHPLDTSDCKLKPTPVFYYYKPGSRCEMQMWRGCPTFNKFDSEFLCSHHCIGKLWETNDDRSLEIQSIDNEPTDVCHMPMNEDDCGVKDQFKYTFIGDLCIRVEWKGCESPNLFDDEEICVKTCNPKTNYDVDLKHKLEQLPMDDVIAINDILDSIMLDNATRGPIQQLKLNITTPEVQTTEVEPKTQVAEATSEARSEVIETTTVAVETMSESAETTSVGETTVAEEITPTEKTAVAEETTVAEEPMVEATTEAATPDTTIATEAVTNAMEEQGSAEEVITT